MIIRKADDSLAVAEIADELDPEALKLDGVRVMIDPPEHCRRGLHFFNRMFFAQADKDSLIIDERSNGGGAACTCPAGKTAAA